MSKSAGNGIDPLLLIEKYGSDALRFALIREVAGAGQDIRLDFDRKKKTSSTVEASRNFANKLWNATKFALINTTKNGNRENMEFELNKLELSDQWILSRLNKTKNNVTDLIHNYKLGEAAKLIYEFTWNDFCDWYVEFLKPRFNAKTSSSRSTDENLLIHILNDILVMLNPFMPHLTEELWHALNNQSQNKLLSLQSWPSISNDYINNELEKSFEELFEIIRLIRNLRAEIGLKPSQLISIYLISKNTKLLNFLRLSVEDIKLFTKSENVYILQEDEINKKDYAKSFSGIVGDLEVYLPFKGIVNLDILRDRLTKDLIKVNKEIDALSKRIENKNFVDKAPKDIVNECKLKLNEASSQSKSIIQKLKMLD
tara:strand:- start:892 stop:2004 length:1113 start_codon:yes stop_codon:yes gene_type:complete